MKQRIYNVMYRKTNSILIAKVLSSIIYSFLIAIYFFRRLFLKKTLDINYKDARKKIMELSNKPNKNYICNKRSIDKNIDLSIIIPAYNVSEYIDECLQSVINQKTKYNYEIIVINDGSKDDTLDKIKKYNDNNNLKIIDQKNKGFSGARNVGINIAKGKYLMFVDSDDILCEGAIEELLDKGYKEDADIVQGSFYEFLGENKFYTTLENAKKIIGELNRPLGAPGFPWGKIYKAYLFNNVRFPIDYWYEDTIVSYLLYRLCNIYVSIDKCVYGYRRNYNSITHTSKNSNKAIDTYWIIEEILSEYKDIGLPYDEITYEMTLIQLSSLLYRRIYRLDESIKKNVFILACKIINEIKVPMQFNSLLLRDLEKAFDNKNYNLWKSVSFIL